MKKLRVGILFGGRSGEHEISLLSAASVFKAIDQNKYEVVPIGITKEGRWVTSGDAERLLTGKAGEGARPTQAHTRHTSALEIPKPLPPLLSSTMAKPSSSRPSRTSPAHP